MTVPLCISLATRKGYAYAAVQGSYWCFGGNKASVFTAEGTCDMPCGGDADYMCGGSCVNQIYATGGSFLRVPQNAVHLCVKRLQAT